MSVKDHLLRAWNLWLSNIVPMIIITLVYFVLSIVTIGILMPVMTAGFMHAMLLLIREDREPVVGDLFSHMHLFFPLLLFGIVAAIAVFIGFMLLWFPGFIVAIAIAFCCLYMLQFMTDQEMGVIDSIKASYNLAVNGDISEHIVILVIVAILQTVGSSVGILLLITEPIAMLLIVSVYLERIKDQENIEPELEV